MAVLAAYPCISLPSSHLTKALPTIKGRRKEIALKNIGTARFVNQKGQYCWMVSKTRCKYHGKRFWNPSVTKIGKASQQRARRLLEFVQCPSQTGHHYHLPETWTFQQRFLFSSISGHYSAKFQAWLLGHVTQEYEPFNIEGKCGYAFLNFSLLHCIKPAWGCRRRRDERLSQCLHSRHV